MKRSEQHTVIFGILLLAGAAIFFIAFMLQILNFGLAGPGGGSILYLVGHVLFSVYGFSSLLIPVFLFASAILLFSSKWSTRKGIFLVASIIPFITIAGMEVFTNAIFTGSSLTVSIIKKTTFVLISLLLCCIEYIVISFIADGILGRIEKKEQKAGKGLGVLQIDVVKKFTNETVQPQEQIKKEVDGSQAQKQKIADDVREKSDKGYSLDGDFFASDTLLAELKPLLGGETALTTTGVVLDDEYSLEKELLFAEDRTKTKDSLVNSVFDGESSTFDVGNLLEEELVSDSNVPVFVFPEIQLDDDDSLEEDFVAGGVTAEKKAVSVPQTIQLERNTTVYDEGIDLASDDVYDESIDLASDDDQGYGFFTDDDFIDTEENEGSTEAETVDIRDKVLELREIESPLSTVPRRQKNTPYYVPVEGLLTTYSGGEYWVIDDQTRRAANTLKETLNEFKIEAEVTGIRKGPVVTMFEILPAPGVKLSKIVALGDNIALRLAASNVRIVAPIPGKHAVGIEVPNKERSIVSFKELIGVDMPAFSKMAIPVVLGKDIAGGAQVLDLAKTPHLLIAGSTGSGKSVCVNTMILSILYKRSPQDVRMILIDPKIVELKLYNDIPHLLTPVITEPKKAFQALQYCLCEMERRYALLDGMGVRDINSYNQRIKDRNIATEKLPYIVLVIDEFADLMATTGKELESTVARLAAMSRAIGIHLVLATQRPSIDVITGLIKANIPTRIAFMVASKMDSRIIIDQMGAEKLLGKGDMLYASAVDPFPVRIQGTFVSDDEVENVVEYVKQYGAPDYIDDEIFVDDGDEGFEQPLFGEGEDPLYEKALEIVMHAGKASASYIQRRLKIGYNRAARLVEDMEARGIVGPANGSKPREVLHVM